MASMLATSIRNLRVSLFSPFGTWVEPALKIAPARSRYTTPTGAGYKLARWALVGLKKDDGVTEPCWSHQRRLPWKRRSDLGPCRRSVNPCVVFASPEDVRAVTLVPPLRERQLEQPAKERGENHAGERTDRTNQCRKGSLENAPQCSCEKVFQGFQFVSDRTGSVRQSSRISGSCLGH